MGTSVAVELSMEPSFLYFLTWRFEKTDPKTTDTFLIAERE